MYQSPQVPATMSRYLLPTRLPPPHAIKPQVPQRTRVLCRYALPLSLHLRYLASPASESLQDTCSPSGKRLTIKYCKARVMPLPFIYPNADIQPPKPPLGSRLALCPRAELPRLSARYETRATRTNKAIVIWPLLLEHVDLFAAFSRSVPQGIFRERRKGTSPPSPLNPPSLDENLA
ncbi:hypothetical protein TgHK011_004606 [Trichoderma gracile]|nr:hypothetical protein TgHK011_004606 [Trichoderma gracile]